jgi:hypothetical protein
LVATCLFASLAGCGGNGNPQPIQGAAKEVASVVQRLEKALQKREFRSICKDLLSSAERTQAGGPGCSRILRRTAGDLRRPRIAIKTIKVARDAAVVEVVTTAEGQAPAPDVIRLVRERGRYRIASLGS